MSTFERNPKKKNSSFIKHFKTSANDNHQATKLIKSQSAIEEFKKPNKVHKYEEDKSRAEEGDEDDAGETAHLTASRTF